MKNTKKIILASVFVLFLGIVPHVLAATSGFTALAPIPGLTDTANTAVVNSTSLTTFLNNLYKYLIGLAAILAVIQIIWAGFDIAYTHKDAVGEIMSDKGKIKNAIFGLVLVLSPALVFSIINPSILNLSLNLPALTTATSTTSGSGAGTGTGTADTTSSTITCQGTIYSQTKKVVVPSGKYCANVLPNDASGNNWSNIDSGCTAASTVIDAACSGTKPDSNCQLCGLTTNKSATSKCGTGGTAGVLQIAWCPSAGDATLWLNNNCGLGQQSIFDQTLDASGVATNQTVLCANAVQAQYTFIQLTSSILDLPSELAPLATAGTNAQNGAYAMAFMNACESVGGYTCINHDPLASGAVECSPTPTSAIPSSAPRDSSNNNRVKCYIEVLACQKTAALANSYCSKNPKWTPFQ